MSTCILVLGTPRSGTSCVAGILHHLGVPMYAPKCVGGANEANPKGFFNDTEFEAFCNVKFGTYFPDAAAELTPLEAMYLSTMVASRKRPIWGVKEWRIALFLPQFIQTASDVKIIHMYRDPERSMHSWNEHFTNLDTATLEGVTRAKNLIAEAVTGSGVPVLDVNFDDLIDDPETLQANIAAFSGRPRNAKADAMIDASLRRF